MIFAIVNAGQEADLIGKARAAGALGCTALHARGTVSSDMLNMLGMENKERVVVQMISKASMTVSVMKTLAAHFQMAKAGHGIVFTVPMTRAKGVNAMFRLRDEHRVKSGLAPLPVSPTPKPAKHEAEEESMHQYELLHVIVKSGFADEAMDAAKAAGATGGTILHARGIGARESVKLFGVAIEPEKDVLMIVVKASLAEAVMLAVAEKVGLGQPGQGIAFTVPVNRVIGIAHHEPEFNIDQP
jgi:nitrogen regulatory protein PII